MRAVRCHRFAAFSMPKEGEKPQLLKKFLPLRSVLSLDEVETPRLSQDHVLIQTHYAGECFFVFKFIFLFGAQLFMNQIFALNFNVSM